MSFITYSLDYYHRELQELESAVATEATIYKAKQLLKMLDDLADEGYFELNEKLEEAFQAVSWLRSYISNHHAEPFALIHKPLEESEIIYGKRDLELTKAIDEIIVKAKAGERVDVRMYTTYPYLLESYGDRIYTPKYEENRLFETLYSQDLYFRFSDLRDGKFYVNQCKNAVVEKKALEEIKAVIG